MPRRSAWLEIDLGALAHNVGVVRDLVGPGIAVAAVVKADAYGHGLNAVGRALDGSVEALCVATLDEGLQLREAGVRGRLILLYPVPAHALAEAVAARIEVTLMSPADVAHVVREAGRQSRDRRASLVKAHLAVETGFYRGGLAAEAASSALVELAHRDGVQPVGLWSHLASPQDPAASARAVAILEQASSAIHAAGTDVPPRHIAASGGLFVGSAPAYEMVRPGLALYGSLERELPLSDVGREAASALRPAMSLKACPVALSDVPSGGCVGYGGTWRASRPSRIATLPLGYGDGFTRDSQPGAEVLVRGRRVPVVGIVSMDSMGIDVTDVPGVDMEDEFVLLGEQGQERISASDVARLRNTIEWEVLSGMASRVDRVYHPDAG